MSRQRKTTPPPAVVDVQHESKAAQDAIGRICKAAFDGDRVAFQAAVDLASTLCTEIPGLVCMHPAHADAIARPRVNWPILCASHPDYLARNLRWLHALPLGEDSGWRVPRGGKKTYHFTNPANVTVDLAIKQILAARDAGQPAAVTFTQVWAQVMQNNAGQPEKNRTLRPLGIAYTRKAKFRAKYRPGTEAFGRRVRDGIRDRLKKAYDAMLAPIIRG